MSLPRAKACSDAHCILRDRLAPAGMFTQGGCRHLKERGPELNRLLKTMGAELTELRRVVLDTYAALEGGDWTEAGCLITDAVEKMVAESKDGGE